jgi:hypothetical protein
MTIYILRQMQLQKTIGELYERVNKLIDGMISELEDNLG